MINIPPTITSRIDSLNDLAWSLRNRDDTLAFHNSALALQEALAVGYRLGEAYALNGIGIHYKNRGEYDKAETFTLRSLAVRKKIGDVKMIAGGYNNLATIYRLEGNYPKAIGQYEASYRLLDSIADITELAKVASNLGSLYKRLGDFEVSFGYLSRCKMIRQALGDSLFIGRAALALGGLFESQKELGKALAEYQLALNCFEQRSSKREAAYALNNIGNIYYKKGQFDRAITHYELSRSLKEEMSDWLGVGHSTKNLGLVFRDQGNIDQALDSLTRASEIFAKVNASIDHAESLKEIGEIYILKDNTDVAILYLRKAKELVAETDAKLIQAELYRTLAQVYVQKGNYIEAYNYRAKYDEVFSEIEESYRSSAQMNQLFMAEEHRNQLLEKENELIREQNRSLEAETKFSRLAISGLILLIVFLGTFFFLQLRFAKAKQRAMIAEQGEERSRQKVKGLLREQELKTLNARMKGEESERKRIAQELHDSLGSLLSAIKLYIVKPKNQGALDIAGKLLEKAIEEVRIIAHNLSSISLSKFGLKTALRELSNRINDSNKIDFKVFFHDLDSRLPFETEMEIYRIVQELVSNVLRHADASMIELQLVGTPSTINITLEDDGRGFDQDSITEGMGLEAIRSRVSGMYGDLSIDSSSENGTHVSIDLPI